MKPALMRVQMPRKLAELLNHDHWRYRVAYGGRGSGKSWSFARALLIRGVQQTLRILCVRELQVSIQDSVHRLLADQISALGLTHLYTVQQSSIVSAAGTEFIFSGIRNNVTKIRSMEGIDICWVEEAEKVSEQSWEVLIPTIRKPRSEIWITFNPDKEDDPTYKRFVLRPPPDCKTAYVNWHDNKWFPDELQRDKDYLARVDPQAYEHVYEGKCRINGDAQVLAGKYSIEPFNAAPGWDGPYYGADWGFAADPSALIRCWIHGRKLYIDHEAYGIGVDIDRLPDLFGQVPGARDHVIRADCSRPETISYMRRFGFPRMESVQKWSGSVEDGVAFLRQFEQIIIHPRCRHTQDEARLWSYKQDRLTRQVQPELIDANNHLMDSLRYALQPLIRRGNMMALDYLRTAYTEAQRAKA